MNDVQPKTPLQGMPPIALSLIFAECISVLIAFALTFAPSASGSKNTLAHYIFQDPSWYHIAFVYYIATNIVLSILAVMGFVWFKNQSHQDKE